jgi:hypothetical protein
MSLRGKVAAVVLGLAGPLWAGAQAPAPAVPAAAAPNPAVVRQKEALVRSLVQESPVAARVNSSGNAEAKRLLGLAQDGYHQAVIHIQTGDVAQAEKYLNEAMWSMGKARQLVPDQASRQIEDKVRFQRLKESVDSLRGSYTRHAARGKTAGARDPELARADALMEEAETAENADKFGDAVKLMQQAESILLQAMNKVLGSATLEYAQKFETPAEEFAYELERNRSFADLVPVAVGELKPNPDAARLVERYVDQNKALREQAQREAGNKDYAAALKTIRSGTGYLQRALLTAGLVVPKDGVADNSN